MYSDSGDECVEPYMQQWLAEPAAMDQPMGCSSVSSASALPIAAQQSSFAQMNQTEQQKFLKTYRPKRGHAQFAEKTAPLSYHWAATFEPMTEGLAVVIDTGAWGFESDEACISYGRLSPCEEPCAATHRTLALGREVSRAGLPCATGHGQSRRGGSWCL